MGPDCYVGLDLGTSGCRAIAVDSQRRVLAESRVALPASRCGPSGASEQDPHDWWTALIRALDALARQPEAEKSITRTLFIGLAMIVNMVAAALSGAAIPLIMKKVGIDPAQSSSIILTTVTDVVGFLAFLGFAVLFQKFLI